MTKLPPDPWCCRTCERIAREAGDETLAAAVSTWRGKRVSEMSDDEIREMCAATVEPESTS